MYLSRTRYFRFFFQNVGRKLGCNSRSRRPFPVSWLNPGRNERRKEGRKTGAYYYYVVFGWRGSRATLPLQQIKAGALVLSGAKVPACPLLTDASKRLIFSTDRRCNGCSDDYFSRPTQVKSTKTNGWFFVRFNYVKIKRIMNLIKSLKVFFRMCSLQNFKIDYRISIQLKISRFNWVERPLISEVRKSWLLNKSASMHVVL